MKKLINTLFIRFVMPHKRLYFFVRYLFLGIFFSSAINLANAAQPECAEERSAVAQAFATHLPADPQRVRSALILRQQGEVLCQRGDAESGRVKLNEAVSVMNPNAINTAVAKKQKGESNE